MSASGVDVHSVGIVWQAGADTIRLIFKRTLRDFIRDFNISVIHSLPDHLEGLFAFHPLFDDDNAMTGQHGKNDLPGIIRVYEVRPELENAS